MRLLVGPFGTVVAIEPAPGPFAALQRNVRLNNLHNVYPMHIAAAAVEGNAEFFFDPELPTQGKLASVERTYVLPRAGSTAVPAVPLDALIQHFPSRPDFIKIDVEGAGASALKGAANILTSCNPIIYIELHGPEEQAGVRDELGYIAETLEGRPYR
jgi:FkbM family methyltransferase